MEPQRVAELVGRDDRAGVGHVGRHRMDGNLPAGGPVAQRVVEDPEAVRVHVAAPDGGAVRAAAVAAVARS